MAFVNTMLNAQLP